jgi:transcriptional regulator with XRE-family HTH domain
METDMSARNRISTKPGVIRQERGKLGLSQLEVAVRSGLSLNTISLLERSGHCTAEVATRVAAALGLKLDDLVDGEPQTGGGR